MKQTRSFEAEGSRPDTQIGCNLDKDEVAELARYVAGFQLTLSQLGFLLVLRELSLKRLPQLMQLYERSVPAGRRKRMTTRPKSASIKLAFTQHIRNLNLGSDEAAALLFRAEISEKWLENSIHFCTNLR